MRVATIGFRSAFMAAAAAVIWMGGCARPSPDVPGAADLAYGGGGAVTRWTDALELFVEYPPHLLGVPGDAWIIHLTWLENWQPVREGSLNLMLRGPGGAAVDVSMDAPDRPGVFTAAPTLTATGTWRADMMLAAENAEHAIPVGLLRVFEDEDALPLNVDELPAGVITLLKEQQWSMPFGAALAEDRSIPYSIRVAGEIVAPNDALAHVSSLVAGVIVSGGPSPAPGARVETGETLALIAPTSLDNSYARMRADVAAAEREASRAERLFAVGAIAERRLEHARHDLEVAEAALESIGGAGPTENGEDLDPGLYRLRSPIGGIVYESRVASGQLVEAGTHAFTVVNPETLWFVGRVPARHTAVAGDIRSAWFTVEGAPRVHTTRRVISVGTVIDPDSRTLPVRLEVANPDLVLKVGMFAQGHLQIGDPVRAVSVPVAAVQEEDGLHVVYVEIGGETFQRRVIQPGPSDGSWISVLEGLERGERVVTAGAYQVRLASLGDAEIADHGHPH